ncbi:MAG: hypothetical protein IIX96_00515, partial [Clostridia bacterium]|nr:hypothetical protein [Clostridia bacterium]
LELGDMADLLHERLGRLIAAYPLNTLYLVGSKSEQITRAAIYGGFPSEHIFTFTSLFECAECIMRMSEAGEIVLIKGSHATRLSRLTEILKSKGQDYA